MSTAQVIDFYEEGERIIKERGIGYKLDFKGTSAEVIDFSEAGERIIQARAKLYEICVACGELTDVRKETPTSQRDHYFDDVGQLHGDCYSEIYSASGKDWKNKHSNMVNLIKRLNRLGRND